MSLTTTDNDRSKIVGMDVLDVMRQKKGNNQHYIRIYVEGAVMPF